MPGDVLSLPWTGTAPRRTVVDHFNALWKGRGADVYVGASYWGDFERQPKWVWQWQPYAVRLAWVSLAVGFYLIKLLFDCFYYKCSYIGLSHPIKSSLMRSQLMNEPLL